MANPVPYTGTIDATPQVDPISAAHVDASPAAFGGAVGQALSHIGEVAQNSGKELFERAYATQQLHEHAVANKAVSEYQNALDSAYLKFTENRGGDALSSYQDFQKQADTIREQYSKGMTSQYSQFLFDQESRQYRGRVVFAAGNYAHEQFKVFQNETSVARIAAIGQGLSNVADQFGAIDEAMVKAKAEAHNIALQHGIHPGDSAYDGFTKPLTDKAILPTLEKYLSGDSKSIETAGRLLDGMKDKLSPDVYAKYNEEYKRKSVTVSAQESGSMWFHNNQSYEMKDLMDKAQERAAKEFPNNTLAQDAFVEKVRVNALHLKENTRIDREAAVELVTKGVYGRMTQDGKLPTSPTELFALDPAMKDQYNKLSAAQQKSVDATLEKNITGGYRPTEENKKIYDMYRAAAIDPNSTPAERQKFLDTFIPSLPIPGEWAEKLMRMQAGMRKGTQEAPRMTEALRAISGIIGPNGYNLSKENDKDEYNLFVSRYHDAIESYTQGDVKPIKDDEVYRNIARSLLQDNKNFPRHSDWNPFGSVTFDPAYRTPGNATNRAEAVQKLKAARAKLGITGEPTEDEIGSYLIKDLFKKSGKIQQMEPK